MRIIPKPFLKTLCRMVNVHGLSVSQQFTDAFLIALIESGVPDVKEIAVNVFAKASFHQLVKVLQLIHGLKKDLAEVIADDPRHLVYSNYVDWLGQQEIASDEQLVVLRHVRGIQNIEELK